MTSRFAMQLVAVLGCCLALACTGGGGRSGNTGPTGSTGATGPTGATGLAPAQAPLTLDAAGVLQAPATATLGETSLSLPAGTTLTLYEDGAPIALPASLSDAAITLSVPEGDGPDLRTAATLLARRRISLTLGGAARKARFTPPSGGPGPALTIQLPAGSTDTLAVLFDVTSGAPAFLGTAPIVAPAATAMAQVSLALFATGAGGGSATFPVPGTGDLDVATGNGSSGGSQAGAGPYWTTYDVPAAPCVMVEAVQVCGPTYLRELNVDEQSTTDIMGACYLGNGVAHATTGVLSPGYQYWCDVAPGPNGGFRVTISGTVANLPIITTVQARVEDDLPLSFDVVPAAEGLHTPDGSVRQDPYTETDWSYGASKILTCKAKGKDINWLSQHAYQPLVDAGYDVQRRNFRMENGYATQEYVITETLDGRLKIGESALKPQGWMAVAAYRNTGTFEHKGLSKLVFKSVITGSAPSVSYSGTLDATVDLTADENGVYSGQADMTLSGYGFTDGNMPPECTLSLGAATADPLDVTALTYSESNQGDGSTAVEASATVTPFRTYEPQFVTCRGVTGGLTNQLIGGSFAGLHQGELGGSGWVFTGDWVPGDGTTIAATKTMSGSYTSGDTTAQETTTIELRY